MLKFFLVVISFFALVACESYSVDVPPMGEAQTSSGSMIVEPTSATPTPASLPVSPKVFEDHDGDGRSSKIDCNDNDPSVYPDAPELCDGKDNNCDGVTDEGCPVLPKESLLSLVVAFPDPATRTMSVEEYDDASKIFDKWELAAKSSGSVIKAPIDSVAAKCGVRFNVTFKKANNMDGWLCEGNGMTAKLDPTATYFLEVKNFGVWIDVTDQVIAWSGEGPAGCSALLVFTQEGVCKLE